ncbi:hypothetical protein Pth03_32310 [Planotetraspora thailandica]|uniref:Uncharacterized protein n=1 Tax=Planotetraspora thailandica TaxID=487172 RepID=A0A8J3V051_9ACTN|nr:hypothetical protein Pth03_32310 [Planotetraspora thailandica]
MHAASICRAAAIRSRSDPGPMSELTSITGRGPEALDISPYNTLRVIMQKFVGMALDQRRQWS